MDRAVSKPVFDDIVGMINGYKQYCFDLGASITGNPSPGNLDGGISTLEDKSLGCTQKGGRVPVTKVLRYGERIPAPGFNLLWAPASDTAGTTALGLCCHMVLFTTGRGTPYGGFVPTVKITTNTPLFEKKPHWNDFNAGVLVEGTSMAEAVENFIRLVLEIAGGKPCKAEQNGFREFVIWKNGISE
jgi:altronate hydrolase